MSTKVYLAGPIAGLDYAGATDWRRQVAAELQEDGIEAYSPMRAKEYLRHIESFAKDCTPYGAGNVLSSNRGITTRDRWDATRCDLLFVNLLHAKSVSIGTVIEIAWADLLRIPIVCAMEKENPHEHGMILEMIGFRLPTLIEAVDIAKAILLQ
jgi:nucleoside 2-deoxyribosyltransferase